MTNYANFNSSHDDYADNRGVMLPGVGVCQYIDDGEVVRRDRSAIGQSLPDVTNFAARNIGFIS